MNKVILKSAFINAAATTIYVVLIGSFLFFAPKIFGQANNVLAPIAMLLLLVFSAALTGSLMFGRPALWYMEGKKKDALSLLVYTMTFFFGMTVLVLALLYIAG